MGEGPAATLNYDSARVLLEPLVEESPENAFFHVSLGQAYAGLGKRDKALSFGQKAVEMHPIHSDPWATGESILLYYAQIKIATGDFDEAIDHLETLLNIPSQVTTWMLKLDAIYDPIRDHPRFQKMIADHS
jgi:predicted Zn-dependent protease